MAFDQKPSTWLGAGYSLASSEIKLNTNTHAGVSIGTFTVVAATNVITVASAHGLKVGDCVRVASSTTLPAGMSASTNYYVLTVPATDTLTVSATLGGTVLDITDTGTGTHTIYGIALPELTDAEANATTGDIRKVMFALMQALWTAWNNTATADRPSKVRMYRSTTPDSGSGATYSYNIQFDTSLGTIEVQSE